MAPVEGRFIEVGGLDGAHYAGKKRGMWEETLPMTILHDSLAELEERRGQVAAWLDTDSPAPFFYEETPERVYQAVVNGAAEFAKGEADSEFDVTFVAPDPMATGEEVTKWIETPRSTFNRAGVRYDDDGDAINANQPLYRSGKHGKALLIEEGTTNLLQTSNVPAEEAATLTQGKEHTLTAVGGSATISHRETHALTVRELPKDGTDITDNTDASNFSEKGTLTQTVIRDDGRVFLADAGMGQEMKYGNIQGYASHEGGIHNGTYNFPGIDLLVLASPGGMTATLNDDMSDYLSDWAKIGSSAVITQGASSVTVEAKTPVAETGGSGIRYDHGSTSERWTFVFLYESSFVGTGEEGNTVWISTGATAIRADLPLTNGVPKWGVIRRDGGTYNFFCNGEDHSNRLTVANSTTTRLQFYHRQGQTGRIVAHHAAFFADQYLTNYPAGGLFEWSWTSPEMEMPNLSTCWQTRGQVLPLSATPEPGTTYQHIVEYRVFDPVNEWGEWTRWDFPLDGGRYPDHFFPRDRYLDGWRVQLRHTFRSENPFPGMGVVNQRFTHEAGFHLEGDYLTNPISLSSLGRVLSAEVEIQSAASETHWTEVELWVGDGPDVDNVTWEKTTYKMDDTTKIYDLPGINKGDSVAQKWFRFRAILKTAVCEYSPIINYVTLRAKSTYTDSHTVTLPAVDTSTIGTAVDSRFIASPVTPTGTNVTYERTIDGGQTWELVANGEKLLPDGMDLTGKAIQTRYTMSTADPLYSPNPGEFIQWEIQQPGTDSVIPATSETVFRPVQEVERWQLEAKPYATSWQKHTSKRNPESLHFPVSGVVENKAGTIEFWAEENEMDFLRQLFDIAGQFALWRDAGNYYLRMNKEIVAVVPADKTGWRHFATRWDGSEAAFFVDGGKQWSGSLTEPFSIPDSSLFYLGSNSEQTRQWNGLFDDLRISNLARTDEEIHRAATTGKPATVDNHTTYLLNFDGSYQSRPTFDVGGTAETWPTIEAFLEQDLEGDFQVSHDDLGLFIKIKGPFKAGDHIIFISKTGKLVINNQTAMNRLTIKSRPFPFLPGANRISASPPGVGELTATWRERWK